ncbi:acyl transferase domain-containing protein [Mycena galopus ATCC 62051]|nr:acyl transferase domain-containing protein [Mycena galopus ATCC 62051]
MSSSGIGGSNGHVVLEAPPKPELVQKSERIGSDQLYLIVAGGLSPRSTSALADHIAETTLETASSSDYAAASTVLGRRAKQMSWRAYALATPGSKSAQFSKPRYCGRDANPIVFVFSGQGPQHEDMGRELFRTFAVFRDSILEMDDVFARATGKSMLRDYGLFDSTPSSFEFPPIWPIALTLPSLAMFQMAFFDLLVHLGVRPDIVLGHSAGETAMLYASGAGSKAMALELAIIRGRIFSTLERSGGTMAALSCTIEEAERLLAQQMVVDPDCAVEVACINAPSAVAISGQELAIDAVLERAQQDGIFARKIRTLVPIHSSMMDACRDKYLSEMQALFVRYPGAHTPQILTYSTLTGRPFAGSFDAEYFWQNTRSQVLFAPAIQNLSEASAFIEIAPHPVLSSYLSSMVTESSTVLSTVYRPKPGKPSAEYRDTLDFLGKLTSAGHNCVDFTLLNGSLCSELTLKLPSYPFLKKRFPLYPDVVKESNDYHGPINRSHLRLSRETHPTIAEHVIRGEPIWPAAAFVEMVLEFGATTLFDVSLRSLLPLSSENPLLVEVTLDGSYWKTERLHADGYLSFEVPTEHPDLNIPEIRDRCHSHVDSGFYPSLSHFSAYGPKFRRVTNLYHNSDEVLASVRGLDATLNNEHPYIVHPAILDACFQIAAYRPFHGDFAPNNYYLPSRIEEMILHRRPKPHYFPSHVYVHVRFSGWMPESLRFTAAVVDDSGKPLCTLKFELAKHRLAPLPDIPSAMHVVLQPVFAAARKANSEFDLHSLMHSYDKVLLPSGTLLLADSTLLVDKYAAAFRNLEYSIVNSATSDPFYFILDAQKAAWKPEVTDQLALFDEEEAFWGFGGLNPTQSLDIWILATEGPDAAAGLGLTRSLRREYLFWKIRFVSFPGTFSEEQRSRYLAALPLCMESESDIIISPIGEPLVPRLAPLLAVMEVSTPPKTPYLHQDLGPDRALLDIHRSFAYSQFSAVFGSVIQVHPDVQECTAGSLLVGLQRQTAEGISAIDLASMYILPAEISFPHPDLDLIPGILTSVLALPGLAPPEQHRRAKTLSILVTHSDTVIGSTICGIYSREGLKFSQVKEDAPLLELARMGREGFDLIISGYVEKTHTQVLRTLLRRVTGRVFLWLEELPRILQQDPHSIGDALDVAFSRGYHQAACLSTSVSLVPYVSNAVTSLEGPPRASFDPEKTYVILGGIGSLGSRIALYMVQRGARHIVATSLSGEGSLRKDHNLIVQHVFAYLKGVNHLDIRLEALDASSPELMIRLFESINREIGGCVILTGVIADKPFPALNDTDFATVFAAKTGVLQALQKTTDFLAMEFIVAFSSVVASFGTGGQANYCAANASLEALVRDLPNAYCFICPAVTDSAVIQSGGASYRSRYKHLIEWALSTDELLLWFDDSINKHQNGARFNMYMPRLDWAALDRTHGMPRIGTHLVPSSQIIQDGARSESPLSRAGRIIQNVLSISEDDFDVEVPLTSYGIDSLSAGRLSFALRSVLEVTQLQLLADNSLADIIRKFLQTVSSEPVVEARTLVEETKGMTGGTLLMDDLVRKYTARLTQLAVPPMLNQNQTPSSHIVLLTGSTGGLGSHLLVRLLACDDIQHVYALNRRGSGAIPLLDRQVATLQRQGIDPALAHSEKLTLVEGDLELEGFGLSSEMMDELLSSVTHIIHNAWTVHFMSHLSEFEPLIAGTTRLLEFAIKSRGSVHPTFSFVSTIGVCRNVPPSVEFAPEAPIEDARIAVHSGYGESKWVAERLIQMASERHYLNTNVIRVGLLTGAPSGSWDISQWVPVLVQSGAHIGCLPDGDDEISWIPTSDAAAAIVDMRSTMNETLHVVHPRPTTWRAVMKPLAACLAVPLVPYPEWFMRLKAAAEFGTPSGTDLMALKLIDLFQLGLTRVGNRESMGMLPKVLGYKGLQASQTLANANLPQLGAADAEKWVQYWRDVAFLRTMSDNIH